MSGMPLNIGWGEIALRLGLTVIAGLLVGYNRSEHGKAAGLRTTLLVCLAASVAMIQVNLLLPTDGRPASSFVMNDLMRLPLGILTGVGFIGAGAIIRRDNIVVGVTTAATLWYVTIVGLCLGGGQIELGIIATILGVAALWILQWIELKLRRERRATLSVEWLGNSLSEHMIRERLAAQMRIAGASLVLFGPEARHKLVFEILEFSAPDDTSTPPVCQTIANEPGVVKLKWERP
jgi:putative Mg2+ transporter-C (MgtC) family protein